MALAALTPAGKVVFAVVPLLLSAVYLYLFWCLARGRIASKAMPGVRSRWIRRSETPREFWLHWGWSFGLLTLMAIVLVGGLVRVYMTYAR
jgi:hypothetical protein